MIYNEKGEPITFNVSIVKTPKPNSRYKENTPEFLAWAKAKKERDLIEENNIENARLKASAKRLAERLEDKVDDDLKLKDLCRWHKRLFDI